MGKTMTGAILEGNPFVWNLNDWQLPEDFQVCNDFPGLKVWEANMTAGMLNLCFRHEKVKSNLEKLRLKDKEKDENSEEKEDVEVDINKNEIDNQEEANFVGRSSHQKISDEFPQVPHNVLIAESLREFMEIFTMKLVEENPNFRTTDTYRNNKKSLRFILEQLCSSRFSFHDEICSTLYAFPLRSADSYGQVSNINECIRIVRSLGSGELTLLPYVKTDDENFDDSQDTLGSNTQGQVHNNNVIINKPTRSSD